jgi:hypothetical protein
MTDAAAKAGEREAADRCRGIVSHLDRRLDEAGAEHQR